MIFVTVGTHEQPFNRLIQEVDELKYKGIIEEDVFIQSGYSTYEPINCRCERFISYDEMNQYIESANIIITHGGPSTFMNVLTKGKTPIVVPRLEDFQEHINNHQLEFSLKVKERNYDIKVVKNISDLEKEICALKEDNKEKSILKKNNKEFTVRFKSLIYEMFN